MGLFGKIFLLVIAEIVLIVACVYIHIDEFTLNEEVKKEAPIVKQEVSENKTIVNDEPLKQMVKPDPKPQIPEKIKEVIKPTVIAKEPVKKETIKTVEKIEKKNTPIEKESKEVKPVITDEKVKVLFDKKKEKKAEVIQPTINESVKLEVERLIAQVVKENRIIFKRLSTDVTEKSKKTISQIADILKQHPTIKVEVGGHTDAKGDDEVNAYISKQRALSVRTLLIKDGIDKDRLTAKGYGESQPIVKNDPQGYSIQNRRVEFKVLKD